VEEKIKILLEHVALFEETWQEKSLHGPLKKFFRNYLSGFPEASAHRTRAMLCETTDELRSLLREWSAEPGAPNLERRTSGSAGSARALCRSQKNE
jgi:tRNA-dihydrouridine synthase